MCHKESNANIQQVNEKFFELKRVAYRDGVTSTGDKTGMTLCVSDVVG